MVSEPNAARPQILDGRPVAAAVTDALRRRCAALVERGIQPTLAVARIGNDPAARSYARRLTRTAADAGLTVIVEALPDGASEPEFLTSLARLADNSVVHGILVQMPLPAGLHAEAVAAVIPPAKDVDATNLLTAGKLYLGQPGFVPATAAAVLEIARYYNIPLSGREIVVVGRSAIVGKPAALLLLRENATVTVCHSRTADLAVVTRRAEILVVAIGRPRLISAAMIGDEAVVIDAGINEVDGVLVGDVDHSAVLAEGRCRAITPVPGGVGPVTTAVLLRQVVEAAAQQSGIKE